MKDSREPFHVALRKLMEEHDVGQRELSRRTQRHSGWGTPMAINQLVRGEMPPSVEAMEHVSQALQVRPEFFAEFRMAMERRRFDPRKPPKGVGFKTALRNLGGR